MRRSYRCEAKLRRTKIVFASVALIFLLVYMSTWFIFARKLAAHEQTSLMFRKQVLAMQAVSHELKTARAQLDELVKSRIPGLMPLIYDEPISVDEDYIRNIIFTLVNNGSNQYYEYRLVMHNDSLSVIRPTVEILLFNDIGVQIGEAEVDYMGASDEVIRSALNPGDVRSYTSSIQLIRDEKPRYFLVAVSETGRASSVSLKKQSIDVLSP
jgi:hypothetical protein